MKGKKKGRTVNGREERKTHNRGRHTGGKLLWGPISTPGMAGWGAVR